MEYILDGTLLKITTLKEIGPLFVYGRFFIFPSPFCDIEVNGYSLSNPCGISNMPGNFTYIREYTNEFVNKSNGNKSKIKIPESINVFIPRESQEFLTNFNFEVPENKNISCFIMPYDYPLNQIVKQILKFDSFLIYNNSTFINDEIKCVFNSWMESAENLIRKLLQTPLPETKDINNLVNTIACFGASSTGKSSFLRIVANKLLSIGKHLYYIDLDPGQSEMSSPGFLSITALVSSSAIIKDIYNDSVIESNMISPCVLSDKFYDFEDRRNIFRIYGTELQIIPSFDKFISDNLYIKDIAISNNKMCHIWYGQITPKLDIKLHASITKTLYNIALESAKENKITDPIILVNTPGWNTGFGSNVVKNILATVKPKFVIETSDRLNLPTMFNLNSRKEFGFLSKDKKKNDYEIESITTELLINQTNSMERPTNGKERADLIDLGEASCYKCKYYYEIVSASIIKKKDNKANRLYSLMRGILPYKEITTNQITNNINDLLIMENNEEEQTNENSVNTINNKNDTLSTITESTQELDEYLGKKLHPCCLIYPPEIFKNRKYDDYISQLQKDKLDQHVVYNNCVSVKINEKMKFFFQDSIEKDKPLFLNKYAINMESIDIAGTIGCFVRIDTENFSNNNNKYKIEAILGYGFIRNIFKNTCYEDDTARAVFLTNISRKVLENEKVNGFILSYKSAIKMPSLMWSNIYTNHNDNDQLIDGVGGKNAGGRGGNLMR